MPPSSADARPKADQLPRGQVVLVCAGVWLIYAAVYASVFVLSGYPAGSALRGAIANALPDGLLALVVIATARRLAWPGTGAQRFFAVHAFLAPGLSLAAASLKYALLWVDVSLFGTGSEFRFNWGIAAWHLFLSLLVYVATAGAAHAQVNARRIRSAAEAIEKAETLRARAELSALRAQLNPHFLFNVLHSVLGLVRRDPQLAERSLERLGDLLRYALHVHRDGVDWTALRHEWEFTECYLDLETIRLGERLRTKIQADPAALDRLVPSFSLQPLVENAIRHGIAPHAGGGSLRISAALNGGSLRLEVENDCEGLSPSSPAGESGMGLRVLQERLEALYGGRATLQAGATPDGRFRVVLDLPATGIAEEP